jgi:quercetin dioxygenase-like cupin family protein
MTSEKSKEAARKLVGKVLGLADLVKYQPDAIVSRTVIDKDAGTVTLFAFDEGQRLSEHEAPCDALVQVIDGEAEIIIAGEAMSVKAGEMVIMPAKVPHAVRASAKFKMMLVMIRS